MEFILLFLIYLFVGSLLARKYLDIVLEYAYKKYKPITIIVGYLLYSLMIIPIICYDKIKPLIVR